MLIMTYYQKSSCKFVF